jgi:prephenate dehydrogenase
MVQMEPLPTLLTTATFDHLMLPTEMVRYDAHSVYVAIERDNPFASAVRDRFVALAAEARADLEQHE